MEIDLTKCGLCSGSPIVYIDTLVLDQYDDKEFKVPLCEHCSEWCDSASAHWYRVRFFLHQIGQPTPNKPTVPLTTDRELRICLLMEEVLELAKAMGVDILHNKVPLVLDLMEFTGHSVFSMEGVLDGLADVSVITTGIMVSMGYTDDDVTWIVDQNNLLKIDTGHKDTVTGKWTKAADHPTPDFSSLIMGD